MTEYRSSENLTETANGLSKTLKDLSNIQSTWLSPIKKSEISFACFKNNTVLKTRGNFSPRPWTNDEFQALQLKLRNKARSPRKNVCVCEVFSESPWTQYTDSTPWHVP